MKFNYKIDLQFLLHWIQFILVQISNLFDSPYLFILFFIKMNICFQVVISILLW